MEKISKRVAKPYRSGSSAVFILQKNNCYLEVEFRTQQLVGDVISIKGYVGGAHLCLESNKLSDFLARLREFLPVHSTAMNIHVEIAPYSSEYAVGLHPIFPRIEYNIFSKYWSEGKIASFLEGTYNVLTGISRVVDEFRLEDKSFDSLEKMWDNALSATDKNKKGKLLEEFLSILIRRDDNFIVVEKNLRTESEEIDIVTENTGKTQFYSQLGCPLILFECKNWSSKIGSKEIRDFAQKIQNRPKHLCNVGVLMAASELTNGAFIELVGYRGKDFIVATLERKDIEMLLDKRLVFGSILKDAIRKAGLR